MEDEKVYKGSSTFLKGTQSANPHNDYSQHFVDSGQRPQNFIRDPGLGERFDEYPKLKELINLKDALVLATATKPMYLQADLRSFRLRDLNARFDVILIEPPLAEYQHKAGLISGQEVGDDFYHPLRPHSYFQVCYNVASFDQTIPTLYERLFLLRSYALFF